MQLARTKVNRTQNGALGLLIEGIKDLNDATPPALGYNLRTLRPLVKEHIGLRLRKYLG